VCIRETTEKKDKWRTGGGTRGRGCRDQGGGAGCGEGRIDERKEDEGSEKQEKDRRLCFCQRAVDSRG